MRRPAIVTRWQNSYASSARGISFVPPRPGIPSRSRVSIPHILLRDAAYNATPKRLCLATARAVRRLAGWYGRRTSLRVSGTRRPSPRAGGYRYREQLGPLDSAGEDLARRAGERLAHAGWNATLRSDFSAVASLFSRAREAVRPGSRASRAPPPLGRALRQFHQTDEEERARTETERPRAQAAPSSVLLRLDQPRWRHLERRLPLSPRRSGGSDRCSAAPDDVLAEAWLGVGLQAPAAWQATAAAGALAHAEQALAVPDATPGPARAEIARPTAITEFCYASAWGTTPVVEASARRRNALLTRSVGPLSEVAILGTLSQLQGMAGEFNDARRRRWRA